MTVNTVDAAIADEQNMLLATFKKIRSEQARDSNPAESKLLKRDKATNKNIETQSSKRANNSTNKKLQHQIWFPNSRQLKTSLNSPD